MKITTQKRDTLLTQKMGHPVYTNAELADTHYMYGEVNSRSKAQRL